MNNSILFKQAHRMAKRVIQIGDSYRVTFGACLKYIKNEFSKNRLDEYEKMDALDYLQANLCELYATGLIQYFKIDVNYSLFTDAGYDEYCFSEYRDFIVNQVIFYLSDNTLKTTKAAFKYAGIEYKL